MSTHTLAHESSLPPREDAGSPLAPLSPPATLLTAEDLAARWQVTLERALKRIRQATGLKALNLGTSKYPELRFRIESVEAWERQVEQPTPAFLGGNVGNAGNAGVGGPGGAPHMIAVPVAGRSRRRAIMDGADLLADL